MPGTGTGFFKPLVGRESSFSSCSTNSPSSDALQACSPGVAVEPAADTVSRQRAAQGRAAANAPMRNRGSKGAQQANASQASARTPSAPAGMSHPRAGITLRRVPWQQAAAQSSSNSSSINQSANSFAVGSCPERMFMQQPPPPPPPARVNSLSTQAVSTPQPISAAAAQANRTPASMQLHAPRLSATSSSSRSMLGGAEDSVSWDDVDSPTNPAAGSMMSCGSPAWAVSPLPATAGDSSSMRTQLQPITLQQVQLQQQALNEHSRELACSLPGAPMVARTAGNTAWAMPAQQAVGTSLRGTAAGSYHSLSLLSVQLPSHAQASHALQVPQPAGSVAGLSCSSLVGGSWDGQGPLSGASYCADDMTLQDSLRMGPDGQLQLGSSPPVSSFLDSALLPGQALQHSNSSLRPWADTSGACAAGSQGTDTLALISAQLAAVRAGVGASAAPVAHVAHGARAPAHAHSAFSAPVGMLGSPLDSSGSALLSNGCAEGLGGSMGLQQQLHLSNNALILMGGNSVGVSTAPVATSLGAVSCSAQQAMLPAAHAASAQGGMGGAGAGAAADGNAMAVAVAQLKLQQLMAVEQIQQQLQEEVMRLLPLI